MVAETYVKPLPVADPDTQPFWEGCRGHQLRAQRCADCHTFRWPPRGLCPACLSWATEWADLAGTGRVESFVVIFQPTSEVFAADAPYVIARVLADGTGDRVRIAANVVGCDWEQVRVGMRVRVEFADVSPEVTLPRFRPTE